MIVKATREKRFRPRAVRIDSTVVEADVKYPTDAGLASAGVRVLALHLKRAREADREKKSRVRDRSRAMGRKLRAITRTIRRRSGEAKEEVLALTEQTGELLTKSVKEASAARRPPARRADSSRWSIRRTGALEAMPIVATSSRQIAGAGAGKAIKDRLGSLFDPDARPIRKGKLGKPNEFGFVSQLAEVTEHTKKGARGLILPASTEIGNPAEDTLLPGTVAELQRLGIRVQEVALDGGFNVGPTTSALEDLAPRRALALRRDRARLRARGADARLTTVRRRWRGGPESEMLAAGVSGGGLYGRQPN